MNNIFGPVLVILVTVLFLFLREFILAIGKNRKPYGTQEYRSSVFDLDTQRGQGLAPDPITEHEDRVPTAAPIAVDEFLPELRARALEQSSPPKNGSTTDVGRAQSNRMGMARDLL